MAAEQSQSRLLCTLSEQCSSWELLPGDILMLVFENICSHMAKVCAHVCSRWRAYSRTAIQNQTVRTCVIKEMLEPQYNNGMAPWRPQYSNRIPKYSKKMYPWFDPEACFASYGNMELFVWYREKRLKHYQTDLQRLPPQMGLWCEPVTCIFGSQLSDPPPHVLESRAVEKFNKFTCGVAAWYGSIDVFRMLIGKLAYPHNIFWILYRAVRRGQTSLIKYLLASERVSNYQIAWCTAKLMGGQDDTRAVKDQRLRMLQEFGHCRYCILHRRTVEFRKSDRPNSADSTSDEKILLQCHTDTCGWDAYDMASISQNDEEIHRHVVRYTQYEIQFEHSRRVSNECYKERGVPRFDLYMNRTAWRD